MFTSDLDIYNVIQNPDRFDERDSDLMLCTLNSEYYSLPKLNQLFDKYSSSDNISLFHFRVRSLFDHIYSNTTIQNTVSGIALIDISDHLPVFCISGISANRVKKTIYLRDYSHFDETKYVDDMNSINWTGMFSNHENLQEMTTECINTITQIINKHAPKRKASLSKLKQLTKPWLSKGLIKSIKTKQKLYRSHFLSKDPTKISRYKTYSNVLNKLKTKTKKEYYTQQFQLCKDNLKSTWKLIGTLINRKK